MLRRSATVAYRWDDDYLSGVVGMLNSEGGSVTVWLPSENGGPSAVAYRQVKARIETGIAPDALKCIHFEKKQYDGFGAVELRISGGGEKPYFTVDAGLEQGTWLWRQGSPHRASRSEVLGLIQAYEGASYEEQRCLSQPVNLEKLKQVFRNLLLPFGRPQQLTLGLIGTHGLYTNLAYILSDDRLYRVQINRIEGTEPIGRLLERTSFDACLLDIPVQLWRQAEALNVRRSKAFACADGASPDFPRKSLSKLFSLLILMVDFSADEPIIIRVYEDRMEFRAAGEPPNGTEYTDLLRGESPFRNRRLGMVLSRFYDGVCLALSPTNDSLLYRSMPQLLRMEYDGAHFCMSLPSANPRKPPKPRDDYASFCAKALMLLDEADALDKSLVAEALCITPRRATCLLNRMMREGLLAGRPGGNAFRAGEGVYLPEKPVTLPAGLNCEPKPKINGRVQSFPYHAPAAVPHHR